jgi:hypothetical protein
VKVQPKKSEGGGGVRRVGVGEKVLAATGYERWTASTGNPMLSIHFVCLDDLTSGPGGDVGAVADVAFVLTERASWKLADFAAAMGMTEPFDPDEDEEVEDLIQRGCVVATFGRRMFNGKQKVEVEAFRSCTVEIPEEWDAMIAAGEAGFRRYQEWRANNPRQGGGGSSGGGPSSGGGWNDDNVPF